MCRTENTEIISKVGNISNPGAGFFKLIRTHTYIYIYKYIYIHTTFGQR